MEISFILFSCISAHSLLSSSGSSARFTTCDSKDTLVTGVGVTGVLGKRGPHFNHILEKASHRGNCDCIDTRQRSLVSWT